MLLKYQKIIHDADCGIDSSHNEGKLVDVKRSNQKIKYIYKFLSTSLFSKQDRKNKPNLIKETLQWAKERAWSDKDANDLAKMVKSNIDLFNHTKWTDAYLKTSDTASSVISIVKTFLGNHAWVNPQATAEDYYNQVLVHHLNSTKEFQGVIKRHSFKM